MAMASSLNLSSSPSLSPLFSTKTHHFYSSPLFVNNPFLHNLHRCGSLTTVASRQIPLGVSRSSPEVLRAQASLDEREPMVPPYNVLITGSTKGISFSIVQLLNLMWVLDMGFSFFDLILILFLIVKKIYLIFVQHAIYTLY